MMKSVRLQITLVLAGLVILVVGLVSRPVWARDPAPEGVRYYPDVFEPAVQSQDVNLQSTVYEIFLSMLSSMAKSLYKCDQQCLNAIGNPAGIPASGDSGQGPALASGPTGAIPWLWDSNVTFLERPAVSSRDYLAHVGEKLHLVQPAYAQGTSGFGYGGLAPARKIWTAFRNISYLLATIGFVILSFMIMFRIKISPQAVLSAQQAITKLIVVFLAVTFSYAIAGLIIDLIFVLSFVIISLFVSTGLIGPNPQTVQASLFSGNIFQTMGSLVGIAGQAGQTLNELANQIFHGAFGAANTNIEALFNNLFSGGINIIGQVIIGIAIIYALFRLLFALLFAYLEILILTILAPIIILPDILPGGTAFVNWAKRLFANAMVFPTTTFMLLLSIALVGGADSWGLGNVTGTAPDFSGGLQLPYIGFSADVLVSFLGVGMILMTYKVVDMVKNALKVQAFPYSTAIGAALGTGAGVAGGMIRTPTGAATGAVKEFGRYKGASFIERQISNAQAKGDRSAEERWTRIQGMLQRRRVV